MAKLTLNDAFLLSKYHTKYYLDDYGSLVSDLDDPSLDDLVHSLNWACESVAQRCETFTPREPMTLTADLHTYMLDCSDGTPLFDSGRRIVEPVFVWINGTILMRRTGKRAGIWTFAELVQDHPSYATDSSSQVTVAAWAGDDQIVFNPPPNGDVITNADNAMAGVFLPKILTADDADEFLDVPHLLNEAVPLLAAYRRARPFATEGEHWKRLGSYNEEWPSIADRLRRQNKKAKMILTNTYTPRMA